MERTKPPQKQARFHALERQFQALSTIVSRVMLGRKLGMQYWSGSEYLRDVYEALGYPKTNEITYEASAARYYRQDMAHAIISKPVTGTWRGKFEITESTEAEDTALEKAWRELSDRLRLKAKFARVDRLCGLGTHAVLLLGLSDVRKVEDWQQPVNGATKLKLLYATPLGEQHAAIKKWVTKSSNERFGLPDTYDVTIKRSESGQSTDLVVHHSRLIHVADELLESDVLGRSRLEVVYNRLMDLEKLVGGSAEMFWRGARPGYAAKAKDDFQLTEELLDAMQEKINEYEHNLRRVLMMQGIDFDALTQQVADPDKHVDVQVQMISAVTGIPKRILMGSERGELASTQDSEAWKELLQARREGFAEPYIVRPFIDRCIEYGVLPDVQDESEGYAVEWEDLWSPSDKEKAEVGKSRADALNKYGNTPEAEVLMPRRAFLKHGLGLSDEDINEIEEELEAFLKEEAAEEARLAEEEEQMRIEQQQKEEEGEGE